MPTPLRPRADAARNYEHIVRTARRLFLLTNKPLSLETIAQEAGVGIATLYRHFSTREALIDAVYRFELDALEQNAVTLLACHSGFDAMRRWLDCYAGFVEPMHAMHVALKNVLAPRSERRSGIRGRMDELMGKFLAAGEKDLSLRSDVRAEDLTLACVGLVFAATTSLDGGQVGRVLDLLMASLRPT